MKKILLFSIFSVKTIFMYSQFNCESIKSDSVRIRIVTLSNPVPGEKLPVPYIVVPEENLFVFYSEKYGNWCEMESFRETHFKSTAKFPDARLVICRKKKKK